MQAASLVVSTQFGQKGFEQSNRKEVMQQKHTGFLSIFSVVISSLVEKQFEENGGFFIGIICTATTAPCVEKQ